MEPHSMPIAWRSSIWVSTWTDGEPKPLDMVSFIQRIAKSFSARDRARGFGSPSVHVDTQILERHAIGIEWGSIRRKDSEVLRHEVQHLPDLHFTSAPFLLCSFTLSNVDHSAHKFNEMAGRAQNRMS